MSWNPVVDVPALKKEKRRSRKRQHDPKAFEFVAEITGVDTKSLYSWFHKLVLILPGSQEYEDIQVFIQNSQDHGFGMKVSKIIGITQAQCNYDGAKFGKFRMMLCHGTKAEYLSRILQKGIRKPEAKGQMFGTGIYFADRASKSAQYCNGSPGKPVTGTKGYLFLCEVSLGTMYTAKNARNDATGAPSFTKNGVEIQVSLNFKKNAHNILRFDYIKD